MPRTKRPKVLKLNVDIFITEDEWKLVHLIRPQRINPTFDEAFKHQKEHGNINTLVGLGLPWGFLAQYFNLHFCGWNEKFEDEQLDRHNEGVY